jgi:glycosyltransferase involved in cell wall biosynthesis
MHLVFLTSNFPFGGREPFIETEINFLADAFDKITIVPYLTHETRRQLPNNVELDTSFAKLRRSGRMRALKSIFVAATSIEFYAEILARPLTLFQPAALKRLLVYLEVAIRTKKWAENFLRSYSDEEIGKTIFYSYWQSAQVFGISMVKRRQPQLLLVTRAHRGDLYEDTHKPNYLPFRRSTHRGLNRLFAISEQAKHYVSEKYPWCRDRTEVSRLGIEDKNFINSASTDGIFRLLTCAGIVPRKRIDLFFRGLRIFAEQNPNISLEWQHYGGGEGEEQLKKIIDEKPVANLNAKLHGQVVNTRVLGHFQSQPVDVFASVSASEGIPVSIMEAISYGVPAIATDVGGTAEIVSDENGVLLDANPSPEQIAAAIGSVWQASQQGNELRQGARRAWERDFNATANYQRFTERLGELVVESV